MAIVRMIIVSVQPDQCEQAEQLWKNHCAPLMISQPGCLSEKLLKCKDSTGEYISLSEWESDEAIARYRSSAAHDEIKQHAESLQKQSPAVVKRYERVP